MTSITATRSFSVPLPLCQRPCPGAGHAAELVSQLFKKAVKPVLSDQLPGAGFFRQQDLHEVGAAAQETLRRGAPCQL